MTHVDLFSGIGGFALAAQANGIRTVQFVEIDAQCRDFLSKAWPGVAIHDDIRTFDGTGYADTYILTAGVPCQPASRAGKQRGAEDDRWLWPEAIRVLRETSPAWCLFENPPGIGDLEFDRILADVETQGYEVEVLSIPACAVNAPHRRERYWIVGKRMADSAKVRLGEAEPRAQGQQRHATQCNQGHLADANGNGQIARRVAAKGSRYRGAAEPTSRPIRMADAYEPRPEGADVREGRRDADGLRAERTQGDVAHSGRLEGGQNEPQRGAQRRAVDRRACAECVGNAEVSARRAGLRDSQQGKQRGNEFANADIWSDFVWLPCADGKVRRAIGDTQRMAHGLPLELLEELGAEGRQTPEDCEVHRSILGALGNSIVWPVAERIVSAMIESESNSCAMVQADSVEYAI